MTAAAQPAWLPVLSSIDQSLDEVRAVDELTEMLKGIVRDVRGMVKLARALPCMARFVGAVVKHVPGSFVSTDEVWAVAEAIEPRFFELFACFEPSAPAAPVNPDESIVGLNRDLTQRLAYLQTLTYVLKQQHGRRARPGSPRKRRADLQAVLDSVEVAPEIRLVLHQSRSLPVLILLGAAQRVHADASRRMVQAALREGLDSMISFSLALVGPTLVAAPEAIRDTLPSPMPVAELQERWQRVQAKWTSS